MNLPSLTHSVRLKATLSTDSSLSLPSHIPTQPASHLASHSTRHDIRVCILSVLFCSVLDRDPYNPSPHFPPSSCQRKREGKKRQPLYSRYQQLGGTQDYRGAARKKRCVLHTVHTYLVHVPVACTYVARTYVCLRAHLCGAHSQAA